ncbi:MAG TPA: hypothetical protein VEP90_17595, partial [Methylomirabilota bacterium]|nr:hypothetical protein [Methylomirabilota bacterium]
MDFQTSKPDLTQTIFTESHLQFARTYLETWLQQEKPSWLKNPQGPFGKYWKADDTISACHLINLANMIKDVTSNITPESIPRLNKKIRENLLPRPSDIKQFYETLTELQVAHQLIACVRPLTLEPRIPGQSRAPDIAFQLPEGMTYLDVTVFRGGPLERWEDVKQQIRDAIHKRVIKRKAFLNIDMQIGFEPIKPDQVIKQVLDGMENSPTGKVPVGNKGMIRWEPMPIIDIDGKIGSLIPEIPSFAALLRSPGDRFRTAVGFQANLAPPSPEDAKRINEQILNAIYNKLKEKHDQFPDNQQAFYVIKLGHWGITVDDMLRTLQTY